MSRTYQGGIITNSPATPTGPFQCGTAPGIWTIDQMLAWQKAGVWPLASGGLAPGTFAIFALGVSGGVQSTTREKYIFSGCVVTFAASSSVASSYGAAAGNSTVGIFALGSISCVGVSTTRNKYTYSSGTNGSATASSNVSGNGTATGNSTTGIFYNGNGQQYRSKYTYSGDVNTTLTTTADYTLGLSATGNSTVGIFAYGSIYQSCCGFVPCAVRKKYTYASCSTTAATAASNGNTCGAATGNSTVGIFAFGYTAGFGRSVYRNKYTYSGDVNATATSATKASYLLSAAGNSTVGIFALGCTSPASACRNKYIYSGCVSSSATAAGSISSRGSAASNGTTGVNI